MAYKSTFWKKVWIVCMIIVLLLASIYGSFTKKQEGFDDSPASTHVPVDIVYYINLDHRTDRKTELLSELSNIGIPDEKIVRISGVYIKDRGDVGCSKSHIIAIKKFIESGHDRCIVFEDDFEFIKKYPNLETYFIPLHKAETDHGLIWDVILFAANDVDSESTKYPFLKKIHNSQTASGYMVSKSYAPTLLKNFEEGVKLLEDSYNTTAPKPENYAIDQYWKLLQKTDQWYLFEPKLGKQRKSYSDIEKGVVDYNV